MGSQRTDGDIGWLYKAANFLVSPVGKLGFDIVDKTAFHKDRSIISHVIHAPTSFATNSYYTSGYALKSILGLDTSEMRAHREKDEAQGIDGFEACIDGQQITLPQIDGLAKKQINGIDRYIFGAPGWLLGGVAGIVILPFKETVYSFAALGGSIFNVGIEAAYFSGVDATFNERAVWRHLLGSLGYVAALTITLPSLAIFTLRWAPTIARHVFNILMSPIYATYRFVKFLNKDYLHINTSDILDDEKTRWFPFSEARFKPLEGREQKFGEQVFRELNQTLTWRGRFEYENGIEYIAYDDEGNKIYHTGKKGLMSSIRRVFVSKTPTEKMLDLAWQDYKLYLVSTGADGEKIDLPDTKETFQDYLTNFFSTSLAGTIHQSRMFDWRPRQYAGDLYSPTQYEIQVVINLLEEIKKDLSSCYPGLVMEDKVFDVRGISPPRGMLGRMKASFFTHAKHRDARKYMPVESSSYLGGITEETDIAWQPQ